MKISSGKIQKAIKVVIYGPEGIGKTTLASKFPDPLFIDTEGSTSHMDVKRVDPAPSSWSMLMGYIDEVRKDPSICQTLVIDTADWAERMCVEHVLTKNGWTSIESPGYGVGYRHVNEEFGRFLDRLSDVAEKGVNVVVTAHARIAKFEQPDELGTYDRWTLKLFDSPKSSNAAMLKEWADLLLFCNYKTQLVRPDSKTGGHAKAMGGKRVMYTTHTPAWDAKNRCGLKDEIPMEFSAIASCLPDTREQAVQPAIHEDVLASAQAAAKQHEKIMVELGIKDSKDEPKTEPAPDPEPQPQPKPKPKPKPELKASVPTTNKEKLKALMEQAGISESAIQNYSGEQKYCPADTPFSVYPEDYCGYLLTQWDEIKKELEVPFK